MAILIDKSADKPPAAATVFLVADEGLSVADIEKLGRQRPEVFSSTWMEIAFVISMLCSLSMADFVIGGFQILLPTLVQRFNVPPELQTWPSSGLILVAGAFLFPLGRLADMYGGFMVFVAGMSWFVLWTIAAGFVGNFPLLILCRAMEGLGTAAFLPAGISLLGRIYRPGPRKNLVFSLYGASSPLGFFAGIIVGGMAQDLLLWRWYFWIGGIGSCLSLIGAIATSPRDSAETRKANVAMDWWGFCTTVPGLMLLVFALTESTRPTRGWGSPQIITALVLSILLLAAAVYVEGWVAKAPLIPADIFRVRYMKRMILCLSLSWGVFAIYLYYSNFYIQLIVGKSALITAVWFTPWAVGGLILSTTSGLVLHIFPGRVILIISGVSKVLAVLLFALMPSQPNYWAWVFPAMVCEAACVDVLWTVSNVFMTTSLPQHRQGLAGAVISLTLFLGGAFFLAVADVAKSQFKAAGMGLQGQFKGIFWVGVVVAGMALVDCFFIKLGKAGSAPRVDDEKLVDECELTSESGFGSGPGSRSEILTTVAGDAVSVPRLDGKPA